LGKEPFITKFKKKVSYCPGCKEWELESTRDYLSRVGGYILMFFGLIMVGVIFLQGPAGTMDMAVTSFLTWDARSHAGEMRALVLNLTEYEGEDTFEFAKELMVSMDRVRYVPVSAYNMCESPEDCIEMGGDCKSISILFTAMMKSVGVDAIVDCNAFEAHHCVTKMWDTDYEEYMIVDLTGDTYAIYRQDIDHWTNKTTNIENGYVDRDRGELRTFIGDDQRPRCYDLEEEKWTSNINC